MSQSAGRWVARWVHLAVCLIVAAAWAQTAPDLAPGEQRQLSGNVGVAVGDPTRLLLLSDDGAELEIVSERPLDEPGRYQLTVEARLDEETGAITLVELPEFRLPLPETGEATATTPPADDDLGAPAQDGATVPSDAVMPADPAAEPARPARFLYLGIGMLVAALAVIIFLLTKGREIAAAAGPDPLPAPPPLPAPRPRAAADSPAHEAQPPAAEVAPTEVPAPVPESEPEPIAPLEPVAAPAPEPEPLPVSDEPFARLVGVTGELAGQEYLLTGQEVGLGRGHCEVRLSDPTVSVRHAVIRFRADGKIVFEDDSTNGSRVDGSAIHRADCELSDGSQIEVGLTTFRFDDLRASEPDATPQPEPKPEPAVYLGAELQVERGPDAGASFPLQRSETTIGRREGQHVQLADPAVSRQHAVVRVEDDHFELVNLSPRGTRLNGELVDQASLADGDEIACGESLLRFRLMS